jgi:molybdopterin-guanine dinucleotide biosynthesis protein A
MLDVEGFILVGGASSRMGTDKSRLEINGRTTQRMIAGELEPVTCRVRVVGSTAETDFENVPDLQERWGPLGGIQAALHACEAESCIILACDLPFVTSALFAFLLGCGEDMTDAIVPIQEDGRPQPLCAIYQREACLAATEMTIAAGQHSPRAMLEEIRVRYVPFENISHLPGSEHFFLNLNHPQDYELAKQLGAKPRKI